jgi:multiple sugar transport system substrate-binding protein
VKSKLVLMGFVVMIVLSVTVLAAPKTTTITYTRWAGTEEAKDFQKLVDRFMAKNPDIKIVTDFLPWDPYWNKLQTTIIGGTAADVISFSHQHSAQYVSKGALYDMTGLPGARQLLNAMQEGTKAPVLVGKKIYGMPVGAGVRAMIYNKAMFTKAGVPYPDSSKPMTWDEFLKIGAKLTVKKDGKVVQYAANFHKREIWESLVVQAGGKYIDNYTKPTKILINNKDGIAGLQFLRTLVDKEIIPPWEDDWEGAFGSPDSAVATEKVAIMQSGPWALNPLKQKKIDFGTAPLFVGKKRANRGYVNFLAIAKNSKNPQAAWRFIKWMCDEGQLDFTKTGDLPANKNYFEAAQKENPYGYSPEIMAAFFSELPYVITGPIVPTNDLITLTEQTVMDLTASRISAAEAAKRIEDQGNKIIANIEY